MMNTWTLLAGLALLAAVGLLIGWSGERRRLLAFYASPPSLRWVPEGRALEGAAGVLDTEWRGLGYEPLGILLSDATPAAGGEAKAVYRHPTLPVFGIIEARGPNAFACAMTFWEGGGALITTAAPLKEARAAAVDTGSPRLVQLRVSGRPLALDGQHAGTVRAWALGKRSALPAAREALIPYLMDDYERARAAVVQRNPAPFRAYLQALAGRPHRVLTF